MVGARDPFDDLPSHQETFRTYGVSRADREPLISFMVGALERAGCRILHRPSPKTAPFRITFETPQGERLGIVAYAFLANNKKTKNRPADEHRFQIKYGSDLSGIHDIWQDPFGLYTTLLLGIDPEHGFFVAADPVIHHPTRFSVSVELKDDHAREILERGWFAWERERRGGVADPTRKRTAPPSARRGEPLFETLVGGRSDYFLRLVRFEREALGEAPGERQFLAEHFSEERLLTVAPSLSVPTPGVSEQRLHALAEELQLPEATVLDLIKERRMLKMAVRGSVAEEHLFRTLASVPGVRDCRKLEDDRGPHVELFYRGRRVTVECKNNSRVRTADGFEKIDLQRTRAAKSDPCSRYYRPTDFDLVAACVHAVTGAWEFKYAQTVLLDPHRTCPGRISNNVKLDRRWTADPSMALQQLLDRERG